MAQEKEQRTFEMLLAQPVPRSHIGVAKILSVIVVSALEVLAFGFAWYYYLKRVQVAGSEGSAGGFQEGSDLVGLFLRLAGPEGVAVFIAAILVSMFSASMLGLIIGGLSRDTRTAGVMIAPLWMVIMFLGIALEFTGFPENRVALALMGLLVIPSPLVALNGALTGSLGVAAGAVFSGLVSALVLLLVLVRLLESDTIIIGLRFRAWRERG
jgi:ABC-type Na+ efflux pump permease subunit